MRILIYSINYHPELSGIGKYTGEMAEWLATKGCAVKVVTAPPYYPAWSIFEGYSSIVYRRETINNVSVVRCPLWVPCKPSGIKRIIHLASFAAASLPVILWNALIWKPNLVFVVEPPLFCAPSSVIAGKLARSNTWLHVQDFEVDAAFGLGILQRRGIRSLVESVERWLMSRFTYVSSVSERMVERLGYKGVPECARLLLENWADIELIHPLERASIYRQELNIPTNRKVLLYSGNMGIKQGLELIIDAAKMLCNRKDLTFVLCGDGIVRADLERRSAICGNIHFLPLQPVERLNELLNLADIHLLPQRSGVEDLVMPSKLTNMLASGKPVIATTRPGTQIAAVVSEAGYIVEPGDLNGLIKAITKLADDPELRLRCGIHGREYAERRLDKNKILSNAFSEYI